MTNLQGKGVEPD